MFWVIKNGIKMTGMPDWSDHSDEEIWAIIAFLKKLSDMTVEDYAKLIMASMQHGGHHHPASERATPSPSTAQPAPSDDHRH